MIALVLGGGPVRTSDRVRALAAEADLVVAADGGLRHARPLGVRPSLLVGDLDSVAPGDLAAWPRLERQPHPREKDDLDLELAIDAARARGATEMRIVGAFGGRIDQTVAAVLIAARLARGGLRVALLDGEHEARPLAADDRFPGPLPEGTLFSLLALGGDARVDVEGAAFPLRDASLPDGRGLGLSNRAAGGPAVRVRAGTVLLVVEWATAPHDARHPKDALWGEDAPAIEAALRATDEDLADLIVDGAYGDVFARPGLDHRTRSLLAIAHLTGLGQERELRTHVRALLRNGGTLREAREAVLHAATFVGIPRALGAMRVVAREAERHVGGDDAAPAPDDA